jgi:hypothetical protein
MQDAFRMGLAFLIWLYSVLSREGWEWESQVGKEKRNRLKGVLPILGLDVRNAGSLAGHCVLLLLIDGVGRVWMGVMAGWGRWWRTSLDWVVEMEAYSLLLMFCPIVPVSSCYRRVYRPECWRIWR